MQESFAVFRDVVQFLASIISAVVAAIAIGYWKNWWTEKRKAEEWRRGIEEEHGHLKNLVEGQERRLGEHDRGIMQTNMQVAAHERRLNSHGKKFVRLQTVVETLMGHKPKLMDDDDSSDSINVG